MYPTQLHSYLLWRSGVDPDPQKLAKRRFTATVSLLPAAMVGIFVFGWYAALVVALAMLTAFTTDFISHRWIWPDSHGTRDGNWLLTGLLIGLMCPPNVPLWLPAIGALLAVLIGKHYLSVDNMPLLQPAAVGLLLLHIIGFAAGLGGSNPMTATVNKQPQWPVLRRSIETSAEEVRAGGVSKMLRDFFGGDIRNSVSRKQWRDENSTSGLPPKMESGTVATATHEPRPIDLVNQNPREYVEKINPEYGPVVMLLGYVPATIGGSSGIALGFGILLLIFTGAASVLLPAFAMLTMFGAMALLSYIGGADPRVLWDNIPIHLLTGSTLIGIWYLADDPTTAPRSAMGKIYAGVALGLFEVFLRGFVGVAEGIVLSVIVVQGLSYVIDSHLAPPPPPGDDNHVAAGVGLSSSSLGRL